MKYVNIYRNVMIYVGSILTLIGMLSLLSHYFPTEYKVFTSIIGGGTIGYFFGTIVNRYFPLYD